MVLAFSLPVGLLYYFQSGQQFRSSPDTAQLVRVIDGDTIDARISGYGQERIRLSGIDAPERAQRYGGYATECLSDILGQGLLTVKVKKTDRYGRLVANLYIDGERVDVQMVERGCAWHYAKYAPGSISLYVAQMRAKADGRGLWEGDNPVTPWDWRRRN